MLITSKTWFDSTYRYMNSQYMHDPEKGGMGFYQVIDTSFEVSFYVLEDRPNMVEMVDNHFSCITVRKEELIDELLRIAEELDRPR